MAANLSKQYARILAKWPKDALRPDVQFQSLLIAREANLANPQRSLNTVAESKNVSALYALLDDRFAKLYPIPQKMLTPDSNPNYYKDIVREVEEAPTRTKAKSVWLYLKGKIQMRWS